MWGWWGEVNKSWTSGNFRSIKDRPICPKPPPPHYGLKREGVRWSWGTPLASLECPPTPTTSAFLLLPRPSLPACLACLLPSSWRAACWEPVVIETRPRRMLQDPGKRDALMCSLQQALCPHPHPEREKEKARTYPHCLPHGLHPGIHPVLPWSGFVPLSALPWNQPPFKTLLPPLSTKEKHRMRSEI